jgi:hypothetical protein
LGTDVVATVRVSRKMSEKLDVLRLGVLLFELPWWTSLDCSKKPLSSSTAGDV